MKISESHVSTNEVSFLNLESRIKGEPVELNSIIGQLILGNCCIGRLSQ